MKFADGRKVGGIVSILKGRQGEKKSILKWVEKNLVTFKSDKADFVT